MSVIAQPVRLDFDDYVRYTEMHADGSFELTRAGIPGYWLIDLELASVVVHCSAEHSRSATTMQRSRRLGAT